MNGRRMFFRLLLRSAMRTRSRSALALVAVMVAAAVTTALLNLYADAEAKLDQGFRSFGANVVASRTTSFSATEMDRVVSTVPVGTHAAPFAYAVAEATDQAPVVVAATDFRLAKQLNGWWSASRWPARPGEALLGLRAQRQLAPSGMPFDLTYAGKTLHLTPGGLLQTGGDEESRVYVSLSDFQEWTGLQPNVIEIAVPGDKLTVEEVIGKLQSALPGARIEPVRQLVEAEVAVLAKTRGVLLGATIVVVVLAMLCLLATLTASVLSRRKDFAVMRSLGASTAVLHGLFLAETSALALIGCALGIFVGVGLAMWIGQANFHAVVTPRWNVLPSVAVGTLLITAIAAAVPMALLGKIQPATMLRGE